jgi:hypothetical protein
MRQHADTAPRELIDPNGEGVYVRARSGDNAYYRAAELLECYWRDLNVETISMIPTQDESWEPVSFRNWRWWLWPLSTEPAVFFYCTSAP